MGEDRTHHRRTSTSASDPKAGMWRGCSDPTSQSAGSGLNRVVIKRGASNPRLTPLVVLTRVYFGWPTILGTAARANAQILHLNGVKEEIALGLRPMRPAYGIKLGHDRRRNGRKFRASDCGK